MLHLTSANCTHLPAEGYARWKRGRVEKGYRAEGRNGLEQGWQWGNLVRSRYVMIVEGESGEFHAFVG